MVEYSRFLPLSQGPSGDESGVTGDWTPAMADCLDAIVAVLERLPPAAWDAQTATGESVRVVASGLADRCASATRHLATLIPTSFREDSARGPEGGPAADAAGSSARGGSGNGPGSGSSSGSSGGSSGGPGREVTIEAGGSADDDGSSRADASLDLPPDAVLARLREASAGYRGWVRRRWVRRPGIRLLASIVVDGYDIGRTVGASLDFPAIATGAVALARVVAAPTPIRAVIRGRTIAATDAGWRLGSGPALSGTAEELVLFLFARGDVPRAS